MPWGKQVPRCLTRLGVKLLLLCSFPLLLFLLLWLVDVLSLVGGISQWRGALHPSSLTNRPLKDILEQRGVSYQNVVEKSDLVKLVEESGHVTKNGVADLLHSPENTEIATVITFSRGVQFYEQVMISAEVWLAIIVASDDIQNYDANNNARIPEMSGKSWSEFQHRLSQLNISIAILDCSKDPKWCKNHKWSTTRFQLFARYSYKEEPKIRSHASCLSLQYVYRWILNILQSRVTQIFTPAQLKAKWLTFESPLSGPELHVVILIDQGLLPPYILALSAQYEGSAQFAWARVTDKERLLHWTDNVDISVDDLSFPVVLAATNEGVYVYGQTSEECYTYTCLRTFLQYFKPTQNASWYASVCVAVMLGILEVVIHETQWLERMFKNASINCFVVILLWVLLDVDYTRGIAIFINRTFRFLAITKFGALVRGDIVFFVNHIYILLLSLLLAIYVMKRLTKIKPVCAYRVIRTDRVSEPETEETEQQPGIAEEEEEEQQRNGLPYQLIPEAEVILLNFLEAQMMESLSTTTAPRHVTTALPVWHFSLETQVSEGFRASGCFCVICQEDFHEDGKMTKLPCEHIFHHACLVQWLNAGDSHACPLCRN